MVFIFAFLVESNYSSVGPGDWTFCLVACFEGVYFRNCNDMC